MKAECCRENLSNKINLKGPLRQNTQKKALDITSSRHERPRVHLKQRGLDREVQGLNLISVGINRLSTVLGRWAVDSGPSLSVPVP